ncbi:hypothetical protein [Moheibacter sediminis]|uniref:Lipoprotein n=1 Tax=Moheibacter sediminis TaxID=1434700 RepID=A0A1W2C7B4_9FLAO|nr:hypothetical protein [Moheibacter sediminis]SMC81043.1 hypothetical protein SAMN06296427_1097 [Moheibacter sediminis]
MKHLISISSLFLLVSCSTNMILKNETYKINNVEGKSTDIPKLFYLLDKNKISYDSLYFKYDKEGYNNCFIYSGKKLVSEFKIKEIMKGDFLAENYFPFEKMGFSFKDSTQFQYHLLIEKKGKNIRLIFDNVEKYEWWFVSNQLDEKIIITLEN